VEEEKKIGMGLVFFRKDATPVFKARVLFWTLYFTICVLSQIWPVYLAANHFTPVILGMPFNMFWVALWIVIIFVGTYTKYRQEY
jgi:hypothetical protein